MEGGALFDPGFLGGQFLWWIGQIPDDATWRDNILPGKYNDKDDGSGWGRRYKVRIIGIHDKSEETVPSDQLPWASVMYPITAGSGSASSYQTPQIRQGNFVFGFFIDGPDQQVPVIMGILGNNPQTPLKTSIGTDEDNFTGVSGFARSQDRPKKQAIPQAPDDDITIVKPKTPEQQQECAATPPGVKLNKFGLRSDRTLNTAQLKDAASAKAEAEAAGLSPEETTEKIKEAVDKGKEARCKKANSPLSAMEPGVSIEAAAVTPHLRSAGDLIRDDLYKERTPLLKPGHITESSQKAIQTVLDNLAEKTRKHLKTKTEFSEAVSNKIPDMEPEIEQASKEIAKFEKISVDKMMEYTLKSLMANAAPTMAAMPGSARFQYADIQQGFTKKLANEYLEITNGLKDSVKSVILDTLKLDEQEKAAMEKAKSLPKTEPQTYAAVDICTSEELLGKSIALERPKINKANDNMLKNMNAFLEDMTSSMAGLTDSLGNMKNQIPDFEGSVTSALQFENITANVFPFEMPPDLAVSDFYTMAEGSGAQPDSMTPSPLAIGEIASDKLPDIKLPKEIPFAEPSKDQGMIDFAKDKLKSKVSLKGALDAAAKVSPQAAAAKAAINIAQGQDPKDAAIQAASDIYGV